MQYVDFLLSEYDWCISQYRVTGAASYMGRAMVLEDKIKECSLLRWCVLAVKEAA